MAHGPRGRIAVVEAGDERGDRRLAAGGAERPDCCLPYVPIGVIEEGDERGNRGWALDQFERLHNEEPDLPDRTRQPRAKRFCSRLDLLIAQNAGHEADELRL